MKRNVILIISLFVTVSALCGNLRSENELKQAAWSVLNSNNRTRGNGISFADLKIVQKLDAISVINDGDNGFAIVANNTDCAPIVGYSFSKYDLSVQPEGFRWWLEAISHSLSSYKFKTRGDVPSDYRPYVEPLIITQWGQDEPFNVLCPYVNGEKSPTGCVATAMAQTLYYYHYPLQGFGFHAYSGGSFDYGSTSFEWGNMLLSYSQGKYTPDQARAVGELLYACGVAVDMNYGEYSSGADVNKVLSALNSYFGYENSGELIWRKDYNGDWMNRLYGELSNGRPVIYCGSTNSQDAAFVNNVSHAFILDGYSSTGLVHVNWGWAGQYDGYFNIDALNPFPAKNDGYNDNQLMIVNYRDYLPHPNLITESLVKTGKKIVGEEVSLSLEVKNTGSEFDGTLYMFSRTADETGSTQYLSEKIYLNTNELKTIVFSFTPEKKGLYNICISTDLESKDIVCATTINVGQTQEIIEFVDPVAKKICVVNWDTDGDGEISCAEAADVKDIGYCFSGVSDNKIRSFDEFVYFTGVKTIKADAFWRQVIESITLPESIEAIEANAFAETKLATITIPANVVEIGTNPFGGCTMLSEINVSADNSVFCSDDGILFNKTMDKLIVFPAGKKVTSYDMPDNISSILGYAFAGNQNLNSISFSKKITSIESATFSNCVSLLSIVIPDHILSINCNAFKGCTNLESAWIGKGVSLVNNDLFGGCIKLPRIDVDPQNDFFCSVDGILMSKDQKILYQYPPGREGAVYEIPNGVSVYYDAFRECKYLETIVIPESITDLGKIFYNSTSIKYVNIPSWITYIPDAAFWECSSLEKIEIPESVETIGRDAFRQCFNLSLISIPSSIKAIGDCAFQSTNIKDVYSYRDTPVAISENVFNDNCYQDAILHVPDDKIENYRADAVWGKFVNIVGINSLGFKDVELDNRKVAEIYDLSGRKVLNNSSSFEALPKGFYIVNGRKIIKK